MLAFVLPRASTLVGLLAAILTLRAAFSLRGARSRSVALRTCCGVGTAFVLAHGLAAAQSIYAVARLENSAVAIEGMSISVDRQQIAYSLVDEQRDFDYCLVDLPRGIKRVADRTDTEFEAAPRKSWYADGCSVWVSPNESELWWVYDHTSRKSFLQDARAGVSVHTEGRIQCWSRRGDAVIAGAHLGPESRRWSLVSMDEEELLRFPGGAALVLDLDGDIWVTISADRQSLRLHGPDGKIVRTLVDLDGRNTE